MDLMTRCERCGKLVEAEKFCMGVWGDYLGVPAVAIGALAVGGDFHKTKDVSAALCPDCMGQLKAWLAGGRDEPQEADESAGSDSAERLIVDMCNMLFTSGSYAGICRYFVHRANSCEGCAAQGAEDSATCLREVRADIKRRCESLGIDIKEDGCKH